MVRPLSVALLVASLVAALSCWRWVAVRTIDPVDPRTDTLLLGASVIMRWEERSPETYRRMFGRSVQNLAVPGFQTKHLERNLPFRTNARTIWLDIGGPDIVHGVRPIVASIAIVRMAETLVDTTHAHVYVVSTLPHPGGEARVEEMNGWTSALLEGYRPDRVTWVPVRIGYDAMLSDRKHPSPTGYELMASQMAPYVAVNPGPASRRAPPECDKHGPGGR